MRILVFEIREPDIYIIFQSSDCFHPLISAAVVHNWNCELTAHQIQSLTDFGKILSGGY